MEIIPRQRRFFDIYRTAAVVGFSTLQIGRGGLCMCVRRSSDNALLNVGFVCGRLNEAALLAHVGGGDGWVETFYSQVGTNNLKQTTNSLQPRIVSGGVIDKINGIPALYFDGTKHMMLTNNITESAFTAFTTHKRLNDSLISVALGNVTTPGVTKYAGYQWSNDIYYVRGNNGFWSTSAINTANQEVLATRFNSATTGVINVNGTNLSVSWTASSISLVIEGVGRMSNGTIVSTGHLQEILYYNTDLGSTLFTAIAADRKKAFNI